MDEECVFITDPQTQSVSVFGKFESFATFQPLYESVNKPIQQLTGGAARLMYEKD